MSHSSKPFIACASLLAATLVASAAESGHSPKTNVPLHGQSQIFFRADKLVGRTAQTPVGEPLGELKDIAFSPGKEIYGVVQSNNDRLIPLPWSLVTAVTEKAVIFNTTAQTLASAPSFTDKQWSKLNDPVFTSQLNSHFQHGTTGAGSSHAGTTPDSSSAPAQGGSESTESSGPSSGTSSTTNTPATNPPTGGSDSGSSTNSASQ